MTEYEIIIDYFKKLKEKVKKMETIDFEKIGKRLQFDQLNYRVVLDPKKIKIKEKIRKSQGIIKEKEKLVRYATKRITIPVEDLFSLNEAVKDENEKTNAK